MNFAFNGLELQKLIENEKAKSRTILPCHFQTIFLRSYCTFGELDKLRIKHLRIHGGRGNARLPHASLQDQRMWGTDDINSQMG